MIIKKKSVKKKDTPARRKRLAREATRAKRYGEKKTPKLQERKKKAESKLSARKQKVADKPAKTTSSGVKKGDRKTYSLKKKIAKTSRKLEEAKSGKENYFIPGKGRLDTIPGRLRVRSGMKGKTYTAIRREKQTTLEELKAKRKKARAAKKRRK